MPAFSRPHFHLPAPGTRRAVVIGAGSFGTALAVLLPRGGLRTTLQPRTEEQAERPPKEHQNAHYLAGGELPRQLSDARAPAVAGVFRRAGVVGEEWTDPIGVELAGMAKNAAALASGATVDQGLNVAGAAAGHIVAEVWRWAESQGARPESMIGLAGT